MPEDDDAWKVLDKSQHATIWNDTESKFWAQFENDQAAWRADHERQVRDLSTQLQLELRQLTGQREALRESHSRLVTDLAKIETELRIVGDRCDVKTNALGALEDDSRQEFERKTEDWEHQAWSMRNFFREKRGQPSLEKPASPEKPPAITNGAHNDEPEGDPMEGVEGGVNGTSQHTPAEDDDVLVNVLDPDGNVIGPVRRIEPWNQWVEAISRLPIQREVKIRRGRRFDHTHLGTIYERGEAKGVKWLSCMIQAKGEVQSKRCTSCDKNQGAFEQCIIVGGDLLQKCGNCEWNRQGCHGASGEQVHIEAAEQLEKEREEEKRAEAERIELMQQRQREHEEAQRREDQRREQERKEREEREERERLERERVIREQQYREEQARLEETRRREQAERERYMRAEHERIEREQHMARVRYEEERKQQEALARQAAERAQADQWRAVRAQTEHERQHERQPDHRRPSEPPREENRHVAEAMAHAHNQRGEPQRAQHVLPSHPLPQKYVLESTPNIAPAPHPAPQPAPQPVPQSAPPPSYPMSSGFKPANSPGGFTPMNQRATPPAPAPAQEVPTPTPAASTEHSPQPQAQPQPQDEKPEVPLVEITRENLVLRHNGTNYTYPECMDGVPLVKIHPGHPYWEPEWKDVRTEIVASKERWEKKHAAAVEAEARKERSGSSKYQIGRQVNRGAKILEFLDDDEQISPYQLLAKKFMHSSKGGITSYDTLFRLCETLSELSKFNLDVTPVDWMRQRLHEIMLEQELDSEVNPFNLPKTVHDFYHDPKLTALRHKHGFKNIGRPSGQTKPGRQSLGSNGGTPKPIKKRKSGAAHVRTPRESEQYVESPLGSQMIIHDEGPFLAARSQLAKRPKSDMGEGDRGDLGFEVESDFSDVDSQYEIPTTSGDFRVNKMQTRQHDSPADHTQYWSFMPNERKFELRILKSFNPPTWGPLDGVDLSLRLSDVAELKYDPVTYRVYIRIPPDADSTISPAGRRGDLMVEFKRWRSMKRFLAVGSQNGIAIERLPDRLLSRWEDFKETPSQTAERETEEKEKERRDRDAAATAAAVMEATARAAGEIPLASS